MNVEVTKMFIKNKEIMNKSAVFRLKLSFPNVSGLALHQWNYQFVETVARFIYAISECLLSTLCGKLYFRKLLHVHVVG